MTSPSWQDFGTYDESEHARLWDGVVGAWAPGLGPTGLRLHDHSRYNRWGTLTNMDAATDWVVDGGQYALDFDGTNDRVTFGSSSILNPTREISVSLWIKVAISTTIVAWAFARDDASLGRSFAFGFRGASDDKLWLQINGSSTLISSTAITKGVWNHVAFTGSAASGYTIYSNGQKNGTANWTAPATTSGDTTIGSRTYLGSEGYFRGLIDDALMWNRVITPNEMLQIYTLGRGGMYQRRRRSRQRAYEQQAGFRSYWARRQNQIIGGGV